MMARITAAERPLYIIAPSLWHCHQAACAYGLRPDRMENVRCITSAYHLRGTRAGTPFITHNREHWVRSMPEIFALDQAIDVMVRTGRLRVAQTDDLAAAQGDEIDHHSERRPAVRSQQGDRL